MDNHEPHDQPYPKHRRFARECALQYLYQTDQQQSWTVSEEELQHFWMQALEDEEDMPVDDFNKARVYAEKLIRGVVIYRHDLDDHISRLARNWKIERMSVIDRNILRVAAYEICRGGEAPPVAALNEALELAKKFGDKDSSRFVNGILDKLMHEQKTGTE